VGIWFGIYIVYWNMYCLLEYVLFIGICIVYWNMYCLLEYVLFIGICIVYWNMYVYWNIHCLLEYVLFIGIYVVYSRNINKLIGTLCLNATRGLGLWVQGLKFRV
jgi:hypothetical protein